MKQSDGSKIFNVDRSLISKWGNEDCFPSFENVNKISNYFNVSFDYIF